MKNIFLTAGLFLSQIISAQYHYPSTPEKTVVDDYFGTKITDNYRWLEDIKNPEVEKWFRSQSDFSHSLINKIPHREDLYKRMKEVQEMNGDSFDAIFQRQNAYFYTKTKKSENLSKLYSRDLSSGKETLIFDPETLGKDTQITNFAVDSKSKKIAILLSKSGGEICTLRILDLTTHQLLNDEIGPIWSEFAFEFTQDDKGILYTKMSTSDPNSNMLLKDMKAMLHVIGTDTKTDKILASREEYPELNALTEQFTSVYFTDDYKYIVLRLSSVKSESPIFVAPYSELKNKKVKWRQIVKPSDDITDVFISGDKLFLLTHKDAPNYKITLTSLSKPDLKNAKIVVPESNNNVIISIHNSKNYLYYSLGDGIVRDKYQVNINTLEGKKVAFPTGVNSSLSLSQRENDNIYCNNVNWLTPLTTYEYNPEKGDIIKSKYLNSETNYPDYNALYTVKEVEVKSHDGVMVPLSIIYPKNMKMDGNNPAYITGYGGYGFSYEPRFSARLSVLLEQGVILAVAHVRGGGEKGERWHEAGMKATKPNTWKDFIACTEYLINQKYTSPSKLIGNGVSAGGILIGRAITERPDLYAVAIPEVGLTNAIRTEITANGPNQIPEIGTLKNEEDTKHLIEMDAQSKVKKGVKYPAVIVRVGMNDSRVVPWMPGKFAAILQNNSASKKPVVLYANYDNGHFTSDYDVIFKEYADIFSFALWQVGHPNFQPSKN
ncbi:prolyl oligopeptidase family serine peptidase [Chryseobacterium gwangjuense]|uniref:prolyl oligopeptidase family serine peptidase n=1 Tax=Chryseobacterium gwangjuense TaxID=1069980 RepID=UPI001E30025A|nr:prolyl oligopeptidase family serine peptidase [Chryseobacterium gwangjuense]MCE3075633.1 prolyl oligopeptidase family serine peptidase [Chryseobacterium gwangjuense]